jgi:DNA-binding NarL/FixJ family response regulator
MNIIIAEDHALIIDGLRAVLEQQEMNVFPAMNEKMLYQLLNEQPFDVLIQDIRFGKTDARTIIPAIRQEFPTLRIIALTSLDDLASIQSVLATNVSGYVLKSEPTGRIMDAIHAVVSGSTYLSPEVQAVLAGNSESMPEVRLSEREKGVLKGILDEKSTKEIAESLFVSEKTVEHYRSNLFIKFDVKNVSGLVKKAILQGFYREGPDSRN